jgi:membrane protein
MRNYSLTRFKIACKTLAQRLFITFQLYSQNGLANHAAAGAYGFLLSLAPMLLLISIFIFYAFQPSPHTISSLISNISFFDLIFDEQWLSGNIFIISRPGIPSLVSVLSILWAGRILALSMHRGLKIIFTGTKTRNPVSNAAVTAAIEFTVFIYILTLIFGSQPALDLFKALDTFAENTFLHFITTTIDSKILPVILLGFISFFAYILVPANHPKKISAIQGAVFFSITYSCLSLLFNLLINPSRYNFLYGALGSLILLIVNIYFLFIFFFLGAQFSFVLDSFDTLLFIKIRQSRIKAAKNSRTNHHDITDRLFFSVEGRLRKYHRYFNKGEIIFNQGDDGDEIYFLLEGEVDVIIFSSDDYGTVASTLQSGSFFGEMSYLLAEKRSATAIARTDASILALPPQIFDEILTYDANLDRNVIEQMSRRIKKTNERIITLSSGKRFNN